jgi:hypothetical protein
MPRGMSHLPKQSLAGCEFFVFRQRTSVSAGIARRASEIIALPLYLERVDLACQLRRARRGAGRTMKWHGVPTRQKLFT